MNNVIICDDFTKELRKILNENYKNNKCLLIVNNSDKQKYDSKIESVKSCDCKFCELILEDFAKNNLIYRKIVDSNILDDVKVIIVFSNGVICDIAKTMATIHNLQLIIIPSTINPCGYLLNYANVYDSTNLTKKIETVEPTYVIVDNNIITNSSKRAISSCYGEIIGHVLTIFDVIFTQIVYGCRFNVECISQMHKIIIQTAILSNLMLCSKEGIIKLFNAKLNIEMLINKLNLKNNYFSLESVNNLMCAFTKENLSVGEISIINALFLSKIFNKFLSVNVINYKIYPNIELRINKLSKYFKILNFNFSLEDKNRQTLVFKYYSIKDFLIKTCNYYSTIINNAFLSFKNLYNDKALFLNNLITKEVLTDSICLSPDFYKGKNILSFLKDFGLLDFNF
jgi:hypothetical protein